MLARIGGMPTPRRSKIARFRKYISIHRCLLFTAANSARMLAIVLTKRKQSKNTAMSNAVTIFKNVYLNNRVFKTCNFRHFTTKEPRKSCARVFLFQLNKLISQHVFSIFVRKHLRVIVNNLSLWVFQKRENKCKKEKMWTKKYET